MIPIYESPRIWSTNFKMPASRWLAVIPDVAGAIAFFILFLVRAFQALQGNPAVWFLAAQSGVIAFLFMFRKQAERSSPWQIRAIAWVSAWMPLAMIVSAIPYLSIPGLLVSIWALAALGRSFSISPADRGIVRRGPYRLLRHPMYAGELLSMLGVCIAYGSVWNLTVLIVFSSFVYIRILEEESILKSYYQYAKETKWRLIPGIW